MNLDFERVTKILRRLAVSDVSFSLSPGKIYGILVERKREINNA